MKLYANTLLLILVIIAGTIAYSQLNPQPDAIRRAAIAHQLARMERAQHIGDIFLPSLAAIVLAAGLGGVRWIWRSAGRPEQIHAEGGLFPILAWDRSTLLDRLTGRRRVTTHDANRAVAATLSITSEADGTIHAAADIKPEQWPDQIAVTKAAIGVQAQQARSTGRNGGPNVAKIKERQGWYDKPQPATAQVLPPTQLPALPQPALSLDEAIRQIGGAGDIPLGQEADGARRLAVWKPAQAPHIAILGSTQQGKSSGAAYTAVLTVIRRGWRVTVLDPEGSGASQWKAISPWAEWAQVDGHSATRYTRAVLDEAERRGRILAAAGAANIGEIDEAARPPRLLVVVEEYAELRDKADAAGTLAAFDFAVGSTAQTGGKLGIHLMLISQSFRSANGTPWPATVRDNCAARLSYNQPGNDSTKSMGGLYELGNLEPGQFAYRGTVYRSWNARPEAERILATIPKRTPQTIDHQPTQTPAPADIPIHRVRPSVPVTYTPPSQGWQGDVADSGQRTADSGQGAEWTDIQQRVAEYKRTNPDAGVRETARKLKVGKSYVSDLYNSEAFQELLAEPVFEATAPTAPPEEDRWETDPTGWIGLERPLSRDEWYKSVMQLRPKGAK